MKQSENIYLALVHHPVVDKNGQQITSAVTNLDLHDLARLVKTYGIKKVFIVTPDKKQAGLAGQIIRHWREGFGSTYNGYRKEALESVKIVESIGDIKEIISGEKKKKSIVIATSANKTDNSITFTKLKSMLNSSENDIVVLLGTAWGLAGEVLKQSDYVLEPIDMKRGYNHLSVRSAASIIIDRLLNE